MTPLWDARFESLMRDALRLLDPGDPLLPDLSTADHGLDSLAMVQLMLSIEDAYGISIPDDLVQPQSFATPEKLWAIVCELSGAQVQ
ncbi:phosphopantetheine-binding protein [Streptomyces sp. AC550_RSS872]|uniref:phosphopantetheine-binding protein n=1 Tax=Streptomyces sp. AC550_RSS872 TaxID=2823689 RepID=UPI001C276360|nr:phosphopantetheine-binding protein [Streptomyces sp. AC550_RSS872]